MAKQDGAETRRERISQIARAAQAAFFASKDEPILLSKFVGAIMFQHGLTKEKLMEYLEVIEAFGQIGLDADNDKIVKPKPSEV